VKRHSHSDVEVPFAAKQLVRRHVAQETASSVGLRIVDGEIAPFAGSAEYLCLKEMLSGIVFDVG
jgi:hypothetical protein